MTSVHEYLKKRYGVENFDIIERNVVLNAATSVPVLTNNPNRFVWVIINLGAAIGYIGFSSAVNPLLGIYLAANGGRETAAADGDWIIPTREVYGIGVGATTLYVLELVGG